MQFSKQYSLSPITWLTTLKTSLPTAIRWDLSSQQSEWNDLLKTNPRRSLHAPFPSHSPISQCLAWLDLDCKSLSHLFSTGAGAAGLSLTYNPTYAAALYGAAFGAASGAYDPALYQTAYAGLPGYPGYSPGTFAAAASEYPGGGYPYPYGAAGRDIRYQGMPGLQSKEVLNA